MQFNPEKWVHNNGLAISRAVKTILIGQAQSPVKVNHQAMIKPEEQVNQAVSTSQEVEPPKIAGLKSMLAQLAVGVVVIMGQEVWRRRDWI